LISGITCNFMFWNR